GFRFAMLICDDVMAASDSPPPLGPANDPQTTIKYFDGNLCVTHPMVSHNLFHSQSAQTPNTVRKPTKGRNTNH
ncbi:hypothetical protein Ancab_034098, partial [Ancistrocladus abbreviatus]